MPTTICVLREVAPGEARVALVPEIASKFKAAGAHVLIQRSAGDSAQFPDAYALTYSTRRSGSDGW
jgi:NAD(P) transhydrogenase subunit alpha